MVRKHFFHRLIFEWKSDEMRKDLCDYQGKEFQARKTKIENFESGMFLVFSRID